MEIGASFELPMFSKAFVWRFIASFEECLVPSAMLAKIGVMQHHGNLTQHDHFFCTANFHLMGHQVRAHTAAVIRKRYINLMAWLGSISLSV